MATGGDPQNQNVEIKISRKLVLELSDESIVEKNGEVKILHIVNSKSLIEAHQKILKFNFEEFSKIFVIVIKIWNEVAEDTDEFLELILEKFAFDSRSLLVEISTENVTKFYIKLRHIKSFESLSRNLNNNDAKLKSNAVTLGLKSNILFQIIKSSLLDADLSKILAYCNESEIHPLMQVVNKNYELPYRVLKLFNWDLAEDFNDKILLHTIELKKFDFLLAFFNAFDESQITQQNIEKILSLKCGSKSQNALIFAIETKNLPLTKLLLQFSTKFTEFFNFKLFEEALNTIKKQDFFEVFNNFKKTEFNFTSEEEKEKKMLFNECEEILSKISLLKKLIEDKKIENIKEFAKKYPKIRLGYGRSEVCALELSIDTKNFNIYALLRSLGFFTDKGKELDKKIGELTEKEKEEIRDENLKHFVNNPEASIGIILSKCTFEPQSPIASTDLREMLLNLNNFDEISSMYPIVAHADVQINFDFGNKYIHVMNPVYHGCEVLGLAYHETGVLYIALNNSKRQRYGTFAHELMHLVQFLIYENECLPYCKGDTEREVDYKKIVYDLRSYCEEHPETEEIIEMVFRYNESEWLIEMAVRVNNMLAFYHDNKEKIVELEGLFPELFHYMRKKVLADLKIPNIYRMIKLNNDFGLLESIVKSPLQVLPTNCELLSDVNDQKVILKSNVPQLVLSKILNEIKTLPGNKLNLKARNFFVNFENIQIFKSEFKDLIKKMKVEVDLNPTLICRVIIDLYTILSKSNLSRKIEKAIKTLQLRQKDNFKILCGLKFQLFFVTSNLNVLPTNFFPKGHNIEQKQIDIQWQELINDTKDHLLDKTVKFQKNSLKVNEILYDAEKSITSKILTILCSDSKIQVNCETKVEKVKKFIERTIQIKKKTGDVEELSLKNFLTATQNEQILVISDVAGSGKTTLLSKIHEILVGKFPKIWTSFVNLKSHLKTLLEGVGNDFITEMIKILKLDELSSVVFTQKFQNNEVIILYDGFDEISPKCKETTLKLFKLFQLQSKNKILITTRTHLEHDLESELKALGHKIKTLSEFEQITFFTSFWKKNNKNLDFELIQKCSSSLVKKISDLIATNPSIIGLPLIIQGLSEAFIDKINDKFEDEIVDLSILLVYQKIYETKMKVITSKYPENTLEYFSKSTSFMSVYQYLAIFYLFDEDFADELGLTRNEEEWPFEEVARGGLVKYDKDGTFQFTHQTHAEHFTSKCIFATLKDKKSLTEAQMKLFVTILTDEGFRISRKFLDEMLEKFEAKNLKIFQTSEKFFKVFIKNVKSREILDWSCYEGLSNIFLLVTKLIKENHFKLYEQILFNEGKFSSKNSTIMLSQSKNEKQFYEILEELLSVKIVAKKIISTLYISNNHELTDKVVSSKYDSSIQLLKQKIVAELNAEELLSFLKFKFERSVHSLESNIFLWDLIESNLQQNEVLEFFSTRDGCGQSFLNGALNSEEIFKYLFFKLSEFCNQEEFKNILSIKDGEGKNVMNKIACIIYYKTSISIDQNTIRLVWNKTTEKLSNEQFLEILSERNNDGNNFLHCAVVHKSIDILMFFCEDIKNLFKDKEKRKNQHKNDELKEFLQLKNKIGSNILHLAAKNKDSNSIKFLFNFIENELGKEELKKMMQACDSLNCLPLHYISVSSDTINCISFFISFFQENFLNCEIEDFLRIKVRIKNKNVLEILYRQSYDKQFCEIFKNFPTLLSQFYLKIIFNLNFSLENGEKNWENVKNVTSNEQILKLICEKNEDGNNLFHQCALQSTGKFIEQLKFVCGKLQELFDDDEKFQMFLLEKGQHGANALILSIKAKNEDCFCFLYENVFCKVFNVKDFIYEIDDDGENFFHKIDRNWEKNSMIELVFNQLKNQLTNEELKEFLQLKNKIGKNLMHLVATLNDKNELIFLHD